ncbi:MAG: hypothetical protein CM15mP8_1450 [Methanobacteriota archaeon]|nr:MAG: hypothetical protein CM15mP8_1450 [Euryarchaeota archaeon]
MLVQITLILGFVALAKGLKIRPSWLNRDGLIMMLSLLLMTLFLITDEGITRIEGIILSSLYVGYIGWLLYNRKRLWKKNLLAKQNQLNFGASHGLVQRIS